MSAKATRSLRYSQPSVCGTPCHVRLMLRYFYIDPSSAIIYSFLHQLANTFTLTKKYLDHHPHNQPRSGVLRLGNVDHRSRAHGSPSSTSVGSDEENGGDGTFKHVQTAPLAFTIVGPVVSPRSCDPDSPILLQPWVQSWVEYVLHRSWRGYTSTGHHGAVLGLGGLFRRRT
jgi:hypothetical protein